MSKSEWKKFLKFEELPDAVQMYMIINLPVFVLASDKADTHYMEFDGKYVHLSQCEVSLKNDHRIYSLYYCELEGGDVVAALVNIEDDCYKMYSTKEEQL